jgi:predicted ester cyclase
VNLHQHETVNIDYVVASVDSMCRSGNMTTTLTLEQMKQFVRGHFEEFVNKRNASVIRKNMTPDFHDHDGPGAKPTGVDGDEQMMVSMYKAMPDLHLTIEDMIAEGDKVVCRNIWRWTDSASGKQMQFHGFVLWRFEGDKIAERWATVTSPAEGVSWTEEARKSPAERAS